MGCNRVVFCWAVLFPSDSARHIRKNQKFEDTSDKSHITQFTCFALQVTLKTMPCLEGLFCAASRKQTWLTILKPLCLLDTNSVLSRKRKMLIRAALSWLTYALTWPLPWFLHLQQCDNWAVICWEVFWQANVRTAHVAVFSFVLPGLYLHFAPALRSWGGEKERLLGLVCSVWMVTSVMDFGLFNLASPVEFSSASEHQDEILKICIS